jgi:hypothetical protein
MSKGVGCREKGGVLELLSRVFKTFSIREIIEISLHPYTKGSEKGYKTRSGPVRVS